MSREREEHMGTADFLAAGEARQQDREHPAAREAHMERAERMDRHPGGPDRHMDAAMDHMQRDLTREHASPMQAPHMEDGRPLDAAASQARMQGQQGEHLEPLFDQHAAGEFRSRWSDVQIGFVDDPQQAVRHADELVAQVMRSLAESFARQRAGIEAGVRHDGAEVSTEELRVALRRYRSFFERLLSL